MFDAEIAAILLNRWNADLKISSRDNGLELLREGNLSFSRQIGRVRSDGVTGSNSCGVELLLFIDGSKALRVNLSDAREGWSCWAAFQPTHSREATSATSSQ
jgi:hypothetical protein